MRQSKLFTKTLRESPKDETAVNADLLVRGGFVSKVMAGVYIYLPLGLRVLEKINGIIRDEMNATGAEELHMSVLQNKDTWSATGRWDSAKDVMYQFKDAADKDTALGWTHEEPLTELAVRHIHSYKDLPKAVYQIQVKFRNEARAKSGLLRGREFFMKDLYSFHADTEDLDAYYERVAAAYAKTFARMDLAARRTLATGGLFCKFSDEFQVLSDAGEDTIHYCTACAYAANTEVAKDLALADICPQCGASLLQGRAIEVGNIFKLGTRFSEAFGLFFTDKNGDKQPVIMASYGIGPGRALATVVETHHDAKGIIWPKAIAPFDVHVVELASKDETKNLDIRDMTAKLVSDLEEAGMEVLHDDREGVSPGEKFADCDLIGIPLRVVVSEKSMTAGGVEIKARNEKDSRIISGANIVNALQS